MPCHRAELKSDRLSLSKTFTTRELHKDNIYRALISTPVWGFLCYANFILSYSRY